MAIAQREGGMSILNEIKNREMSGASDRINILVSQASYRAFSFLPPRYRWIVPSVLESISLPLPEFPQVKEEILTTLAEQMTDAQAVEAEIIAPPPPLYSAYRCVHGNPFACEWPAQTLAENPGATACLRCTFPTLIPPETRLQGRRGQYQFEAFLKVRNWGRLYHGIDLSDRQPVVIKEFLLPDRYFTPQDVVKRRDRFNQVTGIHLADGRHQDLRVVSPSDAIAPLGENRAYLVTDGTLDTFPTLTQYLTATGPMSAAQVRTVLLQMLQTLEGLHGQKYRLPSGIIHPGIHHGNISIDSVLIVPTFQGFYVYLSDPALWENIFEPPLLEPKEPSVETDLRDLGHVAFYLMAGRQFDPETRQPLDPAFGDNWPPNLPQPFRYFVLSLLGLNSLPFESASLARQALLKITLPDDVPHAVKPEGEATEPKPKRQIPPIAWWMLGGVLGLALIALLVWWFRRQQTSEAPPRPVVCCIEQVDGFPNGEYIFTGEQPGIWTYIWQQQNLIVKGKSLGEILADRINPPSEDDPTPAAPDPAAATPPPTDEADGELVEIDRFLLDYRPQPSASEALRQVQQQDAEFAISSLIQDLPADLWFSRVAYDAIAVYVAFSYETRDRSLPTQLNGALSIDDLRRLYTGEIINWNELGGPDLPVKLYIPADEEAVKIFETQILRDQDSIDTFRRLATQRTRTSTINTDITRLSTFRTLNAVLQDFEERDIGAIAFGSLSRIFGQCSVYPLALTAGLSAPVSPLLDKNSNPITPGTDLCNDKGSYKTNIPAIRGEQYPLSYPIALIYPRDNRRAPIGETFADLLRTDEAQLLLQDAGLVPLREIDINANQPPEAILPTVR